MPQALTRTKFPVLITKVAALETKLDVMAANMERLQAQKSQPIIQAEPAHPQAHLAAPVSENAEISDEAPAQVSAAPSRPARFPTITKNFESETPIKSGSTHRGRKRIQSGYDVVPKWPEFGCGFALCFNGEEVSAPHARLAFPSTGRARPLPVRNSGRSRWRTGRSWKSATRVRPTCPKPLSGLARAYDATGDATKAKYYRTVLARAFPKSPVALRSESVPAGTSLAHDVSRPQNAPIAALPSSISDDPAPSFEEETGGDSNGVAPSAPETVSQ